jgi:hypothetical protein
MHSSIAAFLTTVYQSKLPVHDEFALVDKPLFYL